LAVRDERRDRHDVEDEADRAEHREDDAEDEAPLGELVVEARLLALLAGDRADDDAGDREDEREDEADDAQGLARVLDRGGVAGGGLGGYCWAMGLFCFLTGLTWSSPARTGRSARLRPSLWGIPDVSEQGEFSPLSVKNGQKELSSRTSEPRGKEVSGPRAARLAAQ